MGNEEHGFVQACPANLAQHQGQNQISPVLVLQTAAPDLGLRAGPSLDFLFLWTCVCVHRRESFAQCVLCKQISELWTNSVHNSCDGVCYQGNAFRWLASVLPLLFLVPGLEEAIITMLCFALLTLSQKAASL